MVEAHKRYHDRRPRKGDLVTTHLGRVLGVVHRTEGNLCWLDGSDAPWIWASSTGLNAFREWPTRGKTDLELLTDEELERIAYSAPYGQEGVSDQEAFGLVSSYQYEINFRRWRREGKEG